MNYQLLQGDCLDVMTTLDEQSVDAIIADIPYGTTSCAWDSVIPFVPMWECIKRLIKPRGAVVLFGSQPFTSALVMSNVGWFRDEYVWCKDRATRHQDCATRPMKKHENILVFGDSLPAYNPQKVSGHKPAAKSGQRNGRLGEILRSGFVASDSYGQTDRYVASLLEFNVPNHGEMGLHPSQKSVALMAHLIRTYTNEGETVLDFTMGSGSTGVACMETGRNFIGVEKSEEYFKIAEKRIDTAHRQASGQPRQGKHSDYADTPLFQELSIA